MHYKHFSYIALVAILATSLFIGTTARAEVSCIFERDLALGDQGEDVRCLQKYLNSAGFTVAASGPGAPGGETSLYREKTMEAVQQWQQAKGVMPSTGTWGPLSRLTYTKALASALNAQKPVVVTPTVASITAVPSVSDAEKRARAALLAAVSALEDAQDEYDEAEDDDEETGDADEYIEDARNDLFDAIRAFLKGDFDEADDYASSARDAADDASDEIEGESRNDEDRAEEELDEVEEELDEAWDEVADAEDDDDEDVDEAEDLLDEAEDLLEDAEDAFDDEDWDDVLDLVDEIRDLIDEALDSL